MHFVNVGRWVRGLNACHLRPTTKVGAGPLCHLTWLLALFLACRSGEVCGADVEPGKRQQSHPFRMNTVGYLPNAAKQTSIAEAERPFKVVRLPDQKVVFTGESSTTRPNKDTREELSTIDFSQVREPGTYLLEVDGIGASDEFSVSSAVYNQPFYVVMRGMYLARCGTAVAGWHGNKEFSHEACHLHDAHTDFVDDAEGVIDSHGGWHDAGDYNKYVVNAGITVGMMLQAWEHFSDRLQLLNLGLPESENDVPDYLDEIRWEMDWILKTQLPDGSVSHKVSTKKFGRFIAPEEELADRFLVPWGSAATADFVAMTAATSRAFRKFDEDFAKKCLTAAIKSHNFLLEHPDDHPADQTGFTTGGYGTEDVDDRLWAAVELWETSGDAVCLKELEGSIQKMAEEMGEKGSVVDFNWDWADVSNLGMFTYVLSKRTGRSPEILARVKRDVITTADELVSTAKAHGYARPLGDRYYWGCNGTVARTAMVLHVADRLRPNPLYKETVLAAIDHLFGRNYYGRSFVTGLGFEPPRFPHDRRNGINGFADPWPGYLVGGGWPTARDWRDDQEDFRTNEIAINWNGALIYALAPFVEPETFNEVGQDQEENY
jgi:endoglucanase